MTTRRIEIQSSPDVVWQSVKRAASASGRADHVSDATRSLAVKARYGLSAVKLHVSVLSGATPGTAVLDIDSKGQDVWGKASTTVIDRFVASL